MFPQKPAERLACPPLAVWPGASLSPSLNQGLPSAPTKGVGAVGSALRASLSSRLPQPSVVLAPLWPSATATYLVPPSASAVSLCRPRVLAQRGSVSIYTAASRQSSGQAGAGSHQMPSSPRGTVSASRAGTRVTRGRSVVLSVPAGVRVSRTCAPSGHSVWSLQVPPLVRGRPPVFLCHSRTEIGGPLAAACCRGWHTARWSFCPPRGAVLQRAWPQSTAGDPRSRPAPRFALPQPSIPSRTEASCGCSPAAAGPRGSSGFPVAGGRERDGASVHLPGPGRRASAGDSSSCHQASWSPRPCFQTLGVQGEGRSLLHQTDWPCSWGLGQLTSARWIHLWDSVSRLPLGALTGPVVHQGGVLGVTPAPTSCPPGMP